MIGQVVVTTETLYEIQQGYGTMDVLTVANVGAWWFAKSHTITEVPAGVSIKLLETGRGGPPHFDQCYVARLNEQGTYHDHRDTYYMDHKVAQRLGLLAPDSPPPTKPEQVYKAAQFEIEGFEDEDTEQPFAGYTAGESWNGWACPRFTKEVADKVLAACVAQGQDGQFDPATDTYSINDTGSMNPEDLGTWTGYDIQVDGQTVHVYAIGAWGWVWTEYTPPLAVHIEVADFGHGLSAWIATRSEEQGRLLAYGFMRTDASGVQWHGDFFTPNGSQVRSHGAVSDTTVAIDEIRDEVQGMWR